MGHEAWAVIRLRESPTVTLVGGSLDRLEKLADIPLEEGKPEEGRRFDRLVAVPFRQVTERGFQAHDDGAPLAVVDIESEREVPLEELIAALPDEEVVLRGRGRLRDLRRRLRRRGRADHPRRDRQRRGRQPRGRPALPRAAARLGHREGTDRAPPVADQRARRLLDLLLLDRRPVPDRCLAGAARQRARRGRADEPDLRHLPAARPDHRPHPGWQHRRRARPEDPAAGLPRRREGDLRALHGGRRRAEDDVRHLPRGWPGARAVPQADDASGAHRVPPRGAHPVRRTRRAAGHDVRRHRHRCTGGERLPADPRVRVRGPWLLRRRPRADRARRERRTDRGLADRDPHRRREPGRRDAGDRRRDPGARLRARPRGGRDAGQGRGHPVGVRPGARGSRRAGRRRRARPGRGRADRAELPQPAAREVLADRPGRRAAGAVAGRPDHRDRARRGRLREHARPRVLGARHGLAGDPPRGRTRGRCRRPLRRRRPRRDRPRAR